MFTRIEIDEDAAQDIPVPAHISQYVDILGIAAMVEFLLHFGGAVLYIPENPNGCSELETVVGTSNARKFGENVHLMQVRVPLAKPWVAAVMHVSGASVGAIARRLHITDVTVRKYLA